MAHALLSPSSAKQWMTCTPSPRLSEGVPDSSSAFADEGTLAHAYAETFLEYHSDPAGLEAALEELKNHEHAKHYSAELEEHASNFAEYVLEQCTGDYVLEIEQKLDLRSWVPEGFGTGDAIVVKDKVLNLNDLKFGRGVKVSAVENHQLMIYGLGCIDKYGWLYDFDTVRLHIYQPRIGNISVWSISVEDLLAWAEAELKPKAAKAWEGEGDTVAGEHCRFCKVKGQCRALADYSLKLLEKDYHNPSLLSPEDVSEVLSKIGTVEIFIKAVHDFAYGTVLGGGSIPGYKLVKGKSSRAFTDTSVIRKVLNKAGWSDDKINVEPKPPTLLSLTAIEKLLKKKAFTELLGPYLTTKESAPALAPETDKREEYVVVEADFAEELMESNNADWLG